MDELVIGDKTYISSKRAAKITGYAKDYVGQLCREGRVEARLVGRNWYVLETSITEHRFGVASEGETRQEKPLTESPSEAVAWSSPTYVTEVVVPVPQLQKKEEPSPEARKVVSEMQTAWQEWFTNKAEPVALLEEDSEAFDGSRLPMREEEIETVEEEETPIILERIQEKTEYVEDTAPAGYTENVSIEEEYVAHPRTADVMDLSAQLQSLRENMPVREVLPLPSAKEVRRVRPTNYVAIKLAIVVVAMIAVGLAFIGTGAANDVLHLDNGQDTLQQRVINVLEGESKYDNSK